MGERLILGDSLEKLKDIPDNSVDACVTDPPYGLAFMGKKWDYDVPRVELWREVYRVLKPGAHLLSFGGTRTYHRLACAIEDAGFEIRDQVMWIYGSGFPKSLNVGLALDKKAGKENYEAQDKSFRSDYGHVTEYKTDLAKQWQGWGTSLKPANEPICLARKPLERGLTVAENVSKWGTGAINVDASRIEAGADHAANCARTFQSGIWAKSGEAKSETTTTAHAQGRWPANVLFDEEAAAMLDEQSGITLRKDLRDECKSKGMGAGLYEGGKIERAPRVQDHGGGASRFFYVAKTSKRERNAGLEGMPERKQEAVIGSVKNQLKRMQDGVVTGERNNAPKANHHPTVKPIKLMEYLIKLVTPPNGQVLDPFMGSGSTGCAARRLGFSFIGIEREKEYFEIAKRRIEHWANEAEEQVSQDPDQLEMTL